MFVRAIVVAGDRAGADVDVPADLSVTDVRQAVDLAAFADGALFHLYEIANLGAALEQRTGSQAGIRSDVAGFANPR